MQSNGWRISIISTWRVTVPMAISPRNRGRYQRQRTSRYQSFHLYRRPTCWRCSWLWWQPGKTQATIYCVHGCEDCHGDRCNARASRECWRLTMWAWARTEKQFGGKSTMRDEWGLANSCSTRMTGTGTGTRKTRLTGFTQGWKRWNGTTPKRMSWRHARSGCTSRKHIQRQRWTWWRARRPR